jgi:hypothetical protein
MPQINNPYAKSREQLRLLVRLYAVAQGEAEHDRLMRDIERHVLHLAETIAHDTAASEPHAANHDHKPPLSGAV